MKLWGKHEGRAEKQRGHSLLQTYLISLMSLCLSVCMLLGTTMAWFTSGVVVPENEIYVGTLDVDLLWNGKSLKTEPLAEGEPTKLFDDSIHWYPDHVETQTLTVLDQGEIAFTYKLTLTPGMDANGAILDKDSSNAVIEDPEQLKHFRSMFEVYAREGALAEGEEVTSQDLRDATVWKRIGDLNEIYENGLSVFSGASEAMQPDAEGNRMAVHTFAVWMNPDTEFRTEAPEGENEGENAEEPAAEYTADDFQGFRLNFNIKLVANQIGTPEQVTTEEQLIAALTGGRSVVLMEDLELSQNIVLNNTMINGGGKMLNVPESTGYDCAITATGGTIRDLTILGNGYDKGQAIGSGYSGENVQTQNLYIDNVKIDSVLYALYGQGDGKCKVVVTNSELHGGIHYDNVTGVDFVSCTLSDSNAANAFMQICGNTGFTDCTFDQLSLTLKDAIAEGSTISFTNCRFLGDGEQTVAVTAENVASLFGATVSEALVNQLSGCTIVVDGVQVNTSGWANAN